MAESITVLVVEDTPIAQMAAKITLQKAGCLVEVASTGKEAIHKAQRQKFDLILMDIGLEEGTDGFEVTKLIRHDSLNADTLVIILSAHSMQSYENEMKESGISQFITKPLLDDQVQEIIQQICDINKI